MLSEHLAQPRICCYSFLPLFHSPCLSPLLPLYSALSYPSSPLSPCPQKIDCLSVLCGVGETSHSFKAVTRTLHLPVLASPTQPPSSCLSQVNISPYKKKSLRGVAPQAEPLSLGYCRTAGISYHFRFHYCRCADMSQKCLNIWMWFVFFILCAPVDFSTFFYDLSLSCIIYLLGYIWI